MRRLWFKEEMKDAILAGKKTATMRRKALKVGENYQAVSGSRFKAKPFAVIQILTCDEVDSLFIHVLDHYKEEGFSSPEHMGSYLRTQLPQYLTAPVLYYHTFKEIFA